MVIPFGVSYSVLMAVVIGGIISDRLGMRKLKASVAEMEAELSRSGASVSRLGSKRR